MNPIKQPRLLSVVIPAFNEEGIIGTTLSQVEDYLYSLRMPHEIIVINNGSSDRTRQVVADWSKLGHPVKMLENIQNRGKGYAVRQGILSSRGDWVLFMDADSSVVIREMEKCWPLMMEGQWDVLVGSRRVEGAVFAKRQPWLRETFGIIFTRLANLLVCRGIRDFTCGFKCFERQAALDLFKRQTVEDWTFDIEIILTAKRKGYRITQFPVTWTDSPKTSLRMFRDTWVCLFGLLRIWWNLISGKYGTIETGKGKNDHTHAPCG